MDWKPLCRSSNNVLIHLATAAKGAMVRSTGDLTRCSRVAASVGTSSLGASGQLAVLTLSRKRQSLSACLARSCPTNSGPSIDFKLGMPGGPPAVPDCMRLCSLSMNAACLLSVHTGSRGCLEQRPGSASTTRRVLPHWAGAGRPEVLAVLGSGSWDGRVRGVSVTRQ